MDADREEKLRQLEKILHSRHMQASEHLKAFLRFVVVEAIDHRGRPLKEYTIATEVFGRDSSYDPRTDSVVRVQAARLRSKLQQYYATDGKADKLVIDLPKGRYVPTFSYVGNGSEQDPRQLAAQPAQAASLPAAAAFNHWLKFAIAGLAALTLVLALLAFHYRSEARRLKQSAAPLPPSPEEMAAVSQLWGHFLRSPEPVLVSSSNMLFHGHPDFGMKYLVPMLPSEQTDASPAPPLTMPELLSAYARKEDFKWSELIIEDYTGVGEVMGVYSLGSMFMRANRPIQVQRSLLLNWDDVKTRNLIVLGSTGANLFLRQLPLDQDFVIKNERAGLGIYNLKPQPGEQEVYLGERTGPSTREMTVDYALVSFLKGLDTDHRLVVLAGLSTFGTQAAVEYVTRPQHIKDLIARLNTSPDAGDPVLPRSFQIVLKVKMSDGVPVQVSYVTHHVLP